MTPAAPLLLLTGLMMAADPPPILTKAPARGTLREGQRVLVDDRSCPAGQLREIIGGSNAGQRGGGSAAPRRSRCIPRP